MERAVTLATDARIELDDLPAAVARRLRGRARALVSAQRNPPSVGEPLRVGWFSTNALRNKREACRVLGISYHTLQAYLRFPLTGGGSR